MEESRELLTLTDAEGSEVDFEVLDLFSFEGADYAVLYPADDEGPEPEAVILRVLPSADEDEAETLEGIGDEALFERVFAEFVRRSEENAEQ